MQKLTEKFNTAVVKKGEFFAIELPSNPTTGYKWDMQLKAGKASLVMMDYISDAEPGSMLCGSGGKQVFVFEAREAGKIEIAATYKQPWKGGATGHSQNFSVTVK